MNKRSNIMGKSAAEIRREKLRARQEQAVKTRDQKGLGRKSVLDWGRYSGKKPMSYKETSGKVLNVIDFLPWVVTQEWYKDLRTFSGLTTNMDVGDYDYKLELPVHANVGENKDLIICPRLAFGKKCPRCEDLFREYEKEKPDKDITNDLKPSWRVWYNTYDYNEENNPDGVNSVWENVSYYLFEKEILNEAEEGENTILFSDIEEGKTLEIKGKDKTLGKNSFIEAASVEFKDRDPYDEDIVKETVSFDALVKFIPYDEFEKIHKGIEDEPTVDQSSETESEKEPDESSSRNRRRRPAKQEEPNKEEDVNPPWDEKCPDGLVFGEPEMDSDVCKKCADDMFDACIKASDDKKEEVVEEKKEPAKEEVPPRRRRMRGK